MILSLKWLLNELHRRRVFNTVAIYIVGAWVALQAADLAFPGLDIPESAIRFVWIGAFMLFPLVLVFGWRYDISAGGIQRTPPAGAPACGDIPLQRVDHWSIGSLSTAALGVIAVMLVRISSVEPDPMFVAPENSIAVMPFEVCEGHTVDQRLGLQLPMEIISRLSERGTLRVIARTSSYDLAGFGWSKPRIARQLGVEYILSGEVCRDGEALTIAAELRDKDDFIVKREHYKQVANRFDQVESRVASQVADGVAAELGDVVQLAPDTPVNQFAYEHYLIAQELQWSLDFDQALIAIDKALDYQSDFALAMVKKAYILSRLPSDETNEERLENKTRILEEALEVVNRQLETGINSSRLQFAAGEVNHELGHLTEEKIVRPGKTLDEEGITELKAKAMAYFRQSETHFRSSIALGYPDAVAYLAFGETLERLGGAQRRNEAVEVYERGLESDPLNPRLNVALAKRWSDRGRYRQGIELLERFKVFPDVPQRIWWWMGKISASHGYFVEYCELKLELLLKAPDQPGPDLFFFLQVLQQLGLEEEANEWHERLGSMPRVPEWKHWDYMSHTNQQDQVIEKWLASRVANRGDKKTLDGGTDETREALWPLAIPQLKETVKHLEAEYDIGIRHPQTLYLLAEAYAYQGQDEAALDMLEKAVDYHARWPAMEAKDRFYSPWDRLRDDPRFIRQWGRMETDLQQQAESIRAILTQYDIDMLLAPLVAEVEKKAANSE